MIKHVSFDIWNTIFKSNPKFKKYRANYLHHAIRSSSESGFNRKILTVSDIEYIMSKVSKRFDAIAEIDGQAVSSDFMLAFALHEMNAAHLDLRFIQDMITNIFLNDLPLIADKGIWELMEFLKENNISISILSNTGFISGDVIRKALDMLGMKKYFSFEIFSDEVGISKPNKKIYDMLYTNVQYIKTSEGVSRNEICHIGDSVVCDGAAAIYGMTCQLVGDKSDGVNFSFIHNMLKISS